MSQPKDFFSSKPKQIAKAIVKISNQIFGKIDNLEVAIIGDEDMVEDISENLKQFSFGDLGTKFIDKDEAQNIGAVSDRGQSVIKSDFGKQVFNEFKTVIAQNQVELGDKLLEAKDERDRIEGSTTGAFAGITEFIQDVQSQLGAVDKRLSEQVTQIGKDTTELGKSNGDGGAFLDNLTTGLGISLPVLAVGGIAALLLLRR